MSALAGLKKADTCFDIEVNMCLALCERVNTPHSLAVYLAIQDHEWGELKKLEPEPDLYHDGLLDGVCRTNEKVPAAFRDRSLDRVRTARFKTHTDFRADRMVSRMLVKSADVPTGIDTGEDAKRLFADIEGTNAQRLQEPSLRAPWLLELSFEVNRILCGGDVAFLTPETLDKIVRRGRIGPGASAGMRSTVASDKIRGVSTVGPELRPFAEAIKGPGWMAEQPKIVVMPYLQIDTVPKTAWIDRTTSSMPLLNMIVQKGIGDEVADRLKQSGCDSRDTGKNKDLAERAWAESLATIDLSSASSWFTARNLEGVFSDDFIHLLNLVRPKMWIDDTIRSAPGSCGPPVCRELFNWLPMGCGHTFSVMTLYFWALVRITVPPSAWGLCSVYGDDIIVPQANAVEVVARLEYLGFQVNSKKSYLNGNFFESCGTEWLFGQDVLPFYARRGKTGSVSSDESLPIPYRVQLANKLRYWAQGPGQCDVNYRSVWDALVKPVPLFYRPPIPFTLGDVGLWTSAEESNLSWDETALADEWEPVYRVKSLRRKPVVQTCEDPFAYMLWLMRRTQSETMEGELRRLLQPDWYIKPPNWCLKWHDRQCALHRSFIDTEVTEPPFTLGAEPVKGLFGNPSNIWLYTKWPDGFGWSSRVISRF
jgi:hypothetical protein